MIVQIWVGIEMIECACGCGELLEPTDKYGRPHKYIHGHNKSRLGSIGLRGSSNSNWKGGKTTNWAGYRLIMRKGKWIRLHRFIYEQYYKCSLLPWIDIHHKNGNRKDNRIDNLQPLTHGQHSTLTHKGIPKSRLC